MSFYDRVKTSSATASGTGNITWSSADAQYALPPASISETVIYTIADSAGTLWETGRATLSESGGTYTITRGGAQTVTAGSSGAATPVSLTNSAAHTLILTPDAAWFDAPPGTYEVLSSQTASGSSELVFALPTTVYDDLHFELQDITVSVDGASLGIRVSDDNQVSWESGVSDYLWVYMNGSSSTADDTHADGADTHIQLTLGPGNAAGESMSGRLTISSNHLGTSLHKLFMGDFVTVGPTTTLRTPSMGKFYGNTNALTDIRFFPSSGTFSGTIKLVGRVV